MPYSPKTWGLHASLIEELTAVGDALLEPEPDIVHMKQWNVEPAKRGDGDVVYADGTNWDPGSGEGAYIYYAAAWHFLG